LLGLGTEGIKKRNGFDSRKKGMTSLRAEIVMGKEKARLVS
jgi:hypothetical protein